MKTLVLVTEQFPIAGVTESTFLQPELPLLKKEFDRVVIVPKFYEGPFRDPEPTEFYEVDARFARMPRMTALQAMKSLLTTYMWRQIAAHPISLVSPARMRKVLSITHRSRLFANWLAHEYPATAENPVTVYNFWFDIGASAATFIPYSPYCKFFARAHRQDLYDLPGERKPLLLRRHTLQAIEGVWACSEYGQRYLISQFPEQEKKIHCAFLGSTKLYPEMSPTPKEKDPFTFLTVCRLTSVKRVLFTLDCLHALARKHPRMKFRWDVIGDGPERIELERRIGHAPTNLEVVMHGEQPNEQVQRHYVEHPAHFFLLLSESEGLPVAIMESLSYGVPVLSTRIDGIPEAITDGDNGLLMDVNQGKKDFVELIEPYLKDPKLLEQMRERAYASWQARFDAQPLREEFVKMMANWI